MGELSVTEEDYVIAVDGGLSYCGILNVEPDLIIGDFDSMTEQEKLAVEQLQQTVPEKICRLPECKDDTDMLAAIKRGLELGYNDFRIYAATGGRFDHTLANIQCLLYLKNHGAVGYLGRPNLPIFPYQFCASLLLFWRTRLRCLRAVLL